MGACPVCLYCYCERHIEDHWYLCLPPTPPQSPEYEERRCANTRFPVRLRAGVAATLSAGGSLGGCNSAKASPHNLERNGQLELGGAAREQLEKECGTRFREGEKFVKGAGEARPPPPVKDR